LTGNLKLIDSDKMMGEEARVSEKILSHRLELTIDTIKRKARALDKYMQWCIK